MKKLLLLLIFIVGYHLSFAQNWADEGSYTLDWYGDGSQDVFTISTAEEFAGFSVLSNGIHNNAGLAVEFMNKKIVLAADINLSGKLWTPICITGIDEENYAASFNGTFDGAGYKISNMQVNITDSDYGDYNGMAGLFASNDGVLKNISITGTNSVTLAGTNYSSAGGIVGDNYGTVENCYYTGSVTVTGNYAGGIAGSNNYYAIIRNCYSTATATAAGGSAAGITNSYYGTAENCYWLSSATQQGVSYGGDVNCAYFMDNTGTLSADVTAGNYTGNTLTAALNGWVAAQTTSYRQWVIVADENNGYPVMMPVAVPPIITVQPAPVVEALAGAVAQFAVTAESSDGGELTCQWLTLNDTGEWIPVEGAITDVYGITATVADHNRQFRCEITNTMTSGNTASVQTDVAQLKVNVKVIFVYNGADAGNDLIDKTVACDGVYGELPAPCKTGFRFEGWYLSEDFAAEAVTAETEITADGNHNLYAKWFQLAVPPIITVQPTPVVEALAGAVAQFAVTAESPDGGELTCQWLTLNDTGEWIPIEGAITDVYAITATVADHNRQFCCEITNTVTSGNTASVQTDVAQLKVNVKATFVYNGADAGNDLTDKTVACDGVYGELPVPCKTGFRFEGWYLSEDFADEAVTAETEITANENHSLFAKWKDMSGIFAPHFTGINVFPNPVRDRLTVQSPVVVESISIYNLTGKMMKQINISTATIDMSDLHRGIYIVSIQTSNGRIVSKIVKE
ncbi:MAG: InlB B-repeat-containing protein [Cytophagaceae bacterium]|jgi:uncharacterized repeat protein (TIGR02543 family)|nr:InlB B-repeat-containing protein [Cytophagaceae bacterium]